jgi:hypothetical protein
MLGRSIVVIKVKPPLVDRILANRSIMASVKASHMLHDAKEVIYGTFGRSVVYLGEQTLPELPMNWDRSSSLVIRTAESIFLPPPYSPNLNLLRWTINI